MFVHRSRIAAIIFLLLIASATLTELFLISVSAEPSKTSPEHEDQNTPPPPEIKAVAKTGTAPFFKPANQARTPQTLFSLSWFWRSGTVAIALLPLAVLNLVRSIGPHPMESPTPNQGSRIQYFEPNGPPEPWSRLAAETSTHYIYETAWGEYRFRKQLPLMMEFYGPEQGFCRAFQESVNGTITCIDFYSNKPYNGTAITWMEINGVPAAPISFSILQVSDTVFRGYGVLVGGGIPYSLYGVEVKVDFNHSAKAPKITISATLVSGPSRNHRIIWAGLARGTVDVLQQDLAIYANTQAYLGQLKKLRFSYEAGDPQSWRNMIIIDWGDAGPADTYIGRFTVSTLSFTGWMVKFPLNTDIIDPSAQVFSSSTVNLNTSSTGEKSVMTISTSLPSGNKNVIIVWIETGAASSSGAWTGKIRLYSGSTLLAESVQLITSGTAGQEGVDKYAYVFGVDNNPPANASYSVVINVTTTLSATTPIRVLAMVMKATYATRAISAGEASVSAGATATVVSTSPGFPAGKYGILAAYAERQSNTSGQTLNAFNVAIFLDGTSVSSNQFNFYNRVSSQLVNNGALLAGVTVSGNNTFSLRVTNNKSITTYFVGELVVFDVADYVFVDPATSVAVNTTETTIYNLSTTLSGEVAVFAMLSLKNTSSSRILFAANSLKLQINNQSTIQETNAINKAVEASNNFYDMVVHLYMRVDSGVSSPSYQVKATAPSTGVYAEAKMLAFTLAAGQSFSYQLSETVSASDTVLKALVFIRSETVSASDSLSRLVMFLRQMGETTTLSDSLSRLRLVPRDVSDTAAASDIVVRLGVFTRPITESAAASDSLAAFRIFIRAVSEAVSGSDSLSRLVMFLRQMSETTTLSDTLTKMKGFLITVTEAVAASDSFMRAVAFLRHVEEPISLGESLTKPLTSVSLLQTLVAADLLAVVAPSGSGGGVSPPPQAGPQTGVSLPGGDAGLLITLLTVAGGGLAVAAGRRRRKSMGEVWRSVMRPVRMKKPVKIRRLKLRKPVINLRRHRDRMGE
ncbi:MAG: hypothetical protein QXI19_01645 [Candidatus Caldarchaeum sp.]